MTQQELDALKALADAATPGPWESELTGGCYTVWGKADAMGYDGIVTTDYLNPRLDDSSNAAFIAAARAAVPALLAEVERLREELDDYADAIAHERRRRER